MHEQEPPQVQMQRRRLSATAAEFDPEVVERMLELIEEKVDDLRDYLKRDLRCDPRLGEAMFVTERACRTRAPTA